MEAQLWFAGHVPARLTNVQPRSGAAAPLQAFFLLAAGTACWFAGTEQAEAFPLTDALTPSILAPPTEGTTGAPGTTTGTTPGVSTEPTDLTAQIGPPGTFSGAPSPGWTFTPRIQAQTSYNSNVLATHSDPRWDWVNYITPGLTIQGNTERVQARFDYAPTLGLYARTPNLNFLGQNFTGNGSIAFVPDLFYMDVRGVAGVQPRNGSGFGNSALGAPGASTGLPPTQLTQAASASITPYLLHRFEDYGTGKIGYSFNASNNRPVTGFGTLPFIGSSGSASSISSASAAQQAALNQFNNSGLLDQSSNLITNQEIAQFETGEFLGRFKNLTIASGNQYGGNTSTQNGYQYTFNNQLGYAVTRQITVFGALGYENIHYQGVPPTNINDMTWQVGTTLLPNADSSITLGYGHQYGIDAFLVNGAYQVTPRFRVSVSYNTGIGNGLSDLQNNVAISDVNQYGYQVNALTGAPLFNSAGVVGSNSNLYRSKTLSATATLTLDRDVITASVFVSDQQLLATTQANAGLSTASSTSTTAQGSWTHELTPVLSSIVSAAYTTQPSQSTAVSGTQTTLNANLILQYQFSNTLTGSAQYAYYERDSPFTILSFTQNVFLLGLTKTF